MAWRFPPLSHLSAALLALLLVLLLAPHRTTATASCGDGTVPVPSAVPAPQLAQWEWLSALYREGGGDRWKPEARCWNASQPVLVCDSAGGNASSWYGIECEGGLVTSVRLVAAGVTALPASWRGLERVRIVNLNSNKALRQLPASWAGLGAAVIHLDFCGLEAVPASWSGLEAAQWLSVRGNGLTELPPTFDGLGAVQVLALDENSLSAISSWAGLDSVETLSAAKNALAAVPPAWNLGTADTVDLSSNRLQQIPRSWAGLESCTVLRLGHNSIGRLPDTFDGLARVQSLELASCVIEAVPPLDPLASVTHLVLRDNRISELPPFPAAGTALELLDVSTNGLTSLPPFDGLASLQSLYANGNAVGSVASWQGLDALTGLEMESNGLSSLPPSWAPLSRLTHLGLAHNSLEAVPASWAPLNESLKSLDLSFNRIRAAPSVWNLPALETLDVQDNGMAADLAALVRELQHAEVLALSRNSMTCEGDQQARMGASVRLFEAMENPLAECSLVVSPALASLDLSGTRLFVEARSANADADQNALVSLAMGMSPRWNDTPELLATYAGSIFPRLREIDMSGIADASVHPVRGENEFSLLHEVPGQLVIYGGDTDAGLTCPRWQLGSISGEVLLTARADFLEYAQCRCTEDYVWSAAARACVECPAGTGIMCDPYVQRAVHSLATDSFPMLPDGRSAQTGEELLRSAVVRCHTRGVCLGNTRANRWNVSALAHRLPGPPSFTFECSGGRDPSSRRCSCCLPHRWLHGAVCLPCPGPAVVWLFPVAMCAVAAGAVALVWRMSKSALQWSGDIREDSLSALLLFVQLILLLQSYSASASIALATESGANSRSRYDNDGDSGGGGGSGAGKTWAAVSQAVAFLNLPAAWDFGSLRCVMPGFGLYARELVKMLSPLLLLAGAVVVVRVARLDRRTSARVWYCVAFAAHATALPVVASALSVWRCTRPAPGYEPYLITNPQVACGSAGHNALRAGAAVALTLYFAPLVAQSAQVLLRMREAVGGRRDARCGPVACRVNESATLDVPLLDGEEEAAAAAAAPVDGPRERGALPLFAFEQSQRGEAGQGSASAAAHVAVVLVLVRSLRQSSKFWVWPLADMARNVTLAGVVALAEPGSAAVPTVIVLTLTVSAFAVALGQPRSARDNTLHVTALAGAMSVFLVGAFTSAGDDVDPDGTAFANAVLSVLVVTITGLLIYHAVRDFRRRFVVSSTARCVPVE